MIGRDNLGNGVDWLAGDILSYVRGVNEYGEVIGRGHFFIFWTCFLLWFSGITCANKVDNWFKVYDSYGTALTVSPPVKILWVQSQKWQVEQPVELMLCLVR